MIPAGSFYEALNFPPAGHFLFGFEAAASPRSSMVDILKNNAHLRKKLIISVVRNLEAVSVQITDESVRLEPLNYVYRSHTLEINGLCGAWGGYCLHKP